MYKTSNSVLLQSVWCQAISVRALMRILTSLLDGDISRTRVQQQHCYFAVLACTRQHAWIPVSSSGDLQRPQPLNIIHGTSLRGRQEDEEISSGGIQSLHSLLSATLSLQKTSYLGEGCLSSPLQQEPSLPLMNSSKIQHQMCRIIVEADAPFNCNSGGTWWLKNAAILTVIRHSSRGNGTLSLFSVQIWISGGFLSDSLTSTSRRTELKWERSLCLSTLKARSF